MKNLWLASLMLTDGDGVGEEGGRVNANGPRTSVSTAAVRLGWRARLVTSFSQGLFLHIGRADVPHFREFPTLENEQPRITSSLIAQILDVKELHDNVVSTSSPQCQGRNFNATFVSKASALSTFSTRGERNQRDGQSRE